MSGGNTTAETTRKARQCARPVATKAVEGTVEEALSLVRAPGQALVATVATGAKIDELPVRLVWSGSDVDLSGTPSPDGRHMAFVDWSTGDVAVRDLVAGTSRRLTDQGSWAESDAFAELGWQDGRPTGAPVVVRERAGWMYPLGFVGDDGDRIA